mmetsp:Transcript_65664/g.150499  ORF Transcript_65664/g.150499 Transcript_65664/m.150499 type:complete len:213 (-) Transcript_65664:2556-3194(-)
MGRRRPQGTAADCQQACGAPWLHSPRFYPHAAAPASTQPVQTPSRQTPSSKPAVRPPKNQHPAYRLALLPGQRPPTAPARQADGKMPGLSPRAAPAALRRGQAPRGKLGRRGRNRGRHAEIRRDRIPCLQQLLPILQDMHQQLHLQSSPSSRLPLRLGALWEAHQIAVPQGRATMLPVHSRRFAPGWLLVYNTSRRSAQAPTVSHRGIPKKF